MTVPDLDAVAGAAAGCPLVAGMSGGRFGEIATYLPGRRLVGVRLQGEELELHVVARWGTPLPEVADAVRRAVAPVAGGRPVTVYIEDIEVPEVGATAGTTVP